MKKVRILLNPMPRGARQIRLHSWSEKYQQWDTLGKLFAASNLWPELVHVFVSGCEAEGIPYEIVNLAEATA